MEMLYLALLAIVKKLFTKIASQKFLEWALFRIADTIVAKTTNTKDDAWAAKIKALYYDEDVEDTNE